MKFLLRWTPGVTTFIADSTNERLSGQFNILITIPSTKQIKVTGSFTGIPIIY